MLGTGLERREWNEEGLRRLTGQHQETSKMLKRSPRFLIQESLTFLTSRFCTQREEEWLHHVITGLGRENSVGQ